MDIWRVACSSRQCTSFQKTNIVQEEKQQVDWLFNNSNRSRSVCGADKWKEIDKSSNESRVPLPSRNHLIIPIQHEKRKLSTNQEKGMMKLITLPFVLGQPEKKQKTPIKSDPISLNCPSRFV